MRMLLCGWIGVGLLALTACRDAPVATAAAAVGLPPQDGQSAAPAMTGMPHGDHVPHHGGTVYMYSDVHYEVVLSRDGHHRIYFTDSTREDLPAAVASRVTLTIERPKFTAETLAGTIDGQGESWLLEGAPVTQPDVNARVAFVIKGESYWIDVPFITAAPAQTQ